MFSVLAVDSGNSFLKWAYVVNNRGLIQDRVHNQQISQLYDKWELLKRPDIIIVSHVASRAIYKELSRLFNIWDTQPQWVVALSKQCGVTNNYDEPCQLGSDRWAALIAAWDKYHESCLVINIGTAMTVDALSNDGVFLGGIIVPSSHSLLNCIQKNTQININHEKKFCYKAFPLNTTNAIFSGIVQSQIGSIERMTRLFHLQQGYAVKNCIFSGGGAADILPYVNLKYTVIENLVLDGLLIIAKEMQLKTNI